MKLVTHFTGRKPNRLLIDSQNLGSYRRRERAKFCAAALYINSAGQRFPSSDLSQQIFDTIGDKADRSAVGFGELVLGTSNLRRSGETAGVESDSHPTLLLLRRQKSSANFRVNALRFWQISNQSGADSAISLNVYGIWRHRARRESEVLFTPYHFRAMLLARLELPNLTK